mmetsp:Transcript_768/g.3506  ORF Transcript_768/g.3506 Transcript_768/m.3506 type:complete len:483 (+) Transcript_768:4062-5510(+)
MIDPSSLFPFFGSRGSLLGRGAGALLATGRGGCWDVRGRLPLRQALRVGRLDQEQRVADAARHLDDVLLAERVHQLRVGGALGTVGAVPELAVSTPLAPGDGLIFAARRVGGGAARHAAKVPSLQVHEWHRVHGVIAGGLEPAEAVHLSHERRHPARGLSRSHDAVRGAQVPVTALNLHHLRCPLVLLNLVAEAAVPAEAPRVEPTFGVDGDCVVVPGCHLGDLATDERGDDQRLRLRLVRELDRGRRHVVLAVGAVPELSVLGQARGEKAAVVAADPHGELGAARHSCARAHRALDGREAVVVLLGLGPRDAPDAELAVLVAAPRVRVAVGGDHDGVRLAAGAVDDLDARQRLDLGGRGPVVDVPEAELAGLVPAPGEHAAVGGDHHAHGRGASAAHLRDADALERGDPRRLDDVRVLVLVVGLAAADHLPVGHAAEENLALFGAIVRHRLSSVYEGVGEVGVSAGGARHQIIKVFFQTLL